MNGIRVTDPAVSKYQPFENFQKLTTVQKVMVITITFFASIPTIFLATDTIFREIVWHYYSLIPTNSAHAFNPSEFNLKIPSVLTIFDTVPAKRAAQHLTPTNLQVINGKNDITI